MRAPTGASVPLIDDPRRVVRLPSRLALAVLIAVAALGAVSALEPLLGRPYYFPAFAGIVLSAVLAGRRAGLVTTLVFTAAYAYWFLDPRGHFAMKGPHESAALAAYTVTGFFVAWVGGTLRTLYARVRSEHRLLETTVSQREDILRALTHDVRSPLNAIAMHAALLERAEGTDPGVARRARAIRTSVVAIDVMLQDLVKVVALESGQVVLERAPVELHALLDHVRERLGGVLPMERVEVQVPRDLPRLHVDPPRLERVLVNLVSNALKYSEGPVTIDAASRDGEVVVSVRDRGTGIGPEDLPHIFQKYYRAGDARQREGLGLGLYISRLLVEAHGGRIWAESTPGQGSTFHVAIPAAPAPAPAHPAHR